MSGGTGQRSRGKTTAASYNKRERIIPAPSPASMSTPRRNRHSPAHRAVAMLRQTSE